MNTYLLKQYRGLANQYQSIADSKKKQLKIIAFARLISFLSIIPAYYYLSPVSSVLALLASLFFLAIFLFLVKKYIQTEKQLLFNQQLVKINFDEINAIHRDLQAFDDGKEFIDPHHDYSYDLDLFGAGSMFQFLNRTVTLRGKKQLAALLGKSQRTKTAIIQRQLAIQELAEDLNWRQNFMALGIETEEHKNQKQIEDMVGGQIRLKSEKQLQFLISTLPAITLLLIGLNIIGIVTKSFYLIPVFVQWGIFLAFSKTTSKFTRQFDKQAKLLSQYSDMLRQIEAKEFKSEYLNHLKSRLLIQGKTAGTITSELQKILNEFDYRQNILIGIILNSVFLWDVRCLSRLNKWQQKYANELPLWFEVIAEFDALISLGNCNYNHPQWTTPEVVDSAFHLNAEGIGHPLIDEKRCVSNSFSITNEEQIVIITGANMAGKSTFLRTIGVNLILASNGCKVCATGFEFSSIRIYTNMRTSDNLMNDESYFYAELLRLHSMLNLIREGENLFVILDEMLKGTNSVDKLNGSKELIHQLIALKTHGIVATHDLGLTELAQSIPFIKNQCFEVQLHNDELNFDYKLSDGVTRTMNATFLMKKMGIIPND